MFREALGLSNSTGDIDFVPQSTNYLEKLEDFVTRPLGENMIPWTDYQQGEQSYNIQTGIWKDFSRSYFPLKEF